MNSPVTERRADDAGRRSIALPGALSRRALLLASALVAGGLAGCAQQVDTVNPANRLNDDFRQIAFVSPPIRLGVERITVDQPPRQQADEYPIDADFVVSLEKIARLWPRQRLQPVGGGFDAKYIIDDATAVARPNPDGGEVVLATMQVRIELYTLYGVKDAEAGARVESELRITGAPGFAKRQEMLHGLAIEMADKLDEQLTAAIAKHFQGRISPATPE